MLLAAPESSCGAGGWDTGEGGFAAPVSRLARRGGHLVSAPPDRHRRSERFRTGIAARRWRAERIRLRESVPGSWRSGNRCRLLFQQQRPSIG